MPFSEESEARRRAYDNRQVETEREAEREECEDNFEERERERRMQNEEEKCDGKQSKNIIVW